jgi:hypothetical protein
MEEGLEAQKVSESTYGLSVQLLALNGCNVKVRSPLANCNCFGVLSIHCLAM